MFCTSCGSQMDDAARFCPSCGTVNEPEATAGPPLPPAAPPPAAFGAGRYTPPPPPAAAGYGAQPSFNPADYAYSPSPSGRAGRGGRNPGIIAAAVVAVLAVGAIAAFLLLKGGDDAPRLDPANADALAHTALLQVADLPGTGWKLSSEDEFSSDENVFGSEGHCKELSNQYNALDGQFGQLAAKANRDFALEPAEGTKTTVSAQHEVAIYRDSSRINAGLDSVAKIFGDPAFVDCYADSASSPNSKVTGKKVAPYGAAPQSGKGHGFEFTGDDADGKPSTWRVETYSWGYGNSAVTVYVYGDPRDVKPETVKAILASAHARVRDTASGKVKPSGAASKGASPGSTASGSVTAVPSARTSPSPSASVRTSPSPSASVRSSPSPAASTKRDTFDSNVNAWPVGAIAGARATGTRTIAGGKLRYELNATQSVLLWDTPSQFISSAGTDLTIKAEVRKLSGPADMRYGIAFRIQATAGGYHFLVRDDGKVYLQVVDSQGTSTIFDQGSDAAIAKPGEAQVLEVTMRGTRVTLRVNGAQIGEVTDSRFSTGLNGVSLALPTAGTQGVVEYDSYEISGLN